MLAFVLAIGLSFANLASATEVQTEMFASDYVYDNGNWQAIPEQICKGGNQVCRVRFGINGPIYEVYDEMDLSTKKEQSDGTVIVL